jgi:hypothetical protein
VSRPATAEAGVADPDLALFELLPLPLPLPLELLLPDEEACDVAPATLATTEDVTELGARELAAV